MAEFAASERQLEDWVCANIGVVTGDPKAELVARQLLLSNGMILDVLALTREGPSCDMVVIELKRAVIDEAAIAQALTYVGILAHDYTVHSEALHEDDEPVGQGGLRYNGVRALMVAPAITSAACHMLLGLDGLVQYKMLSFSEEGVSWHPFNMGRPMPRDTTREGVWIHLDRIIAGPLDRILAVAKDEPSGRWERMREKADTTPLEVRRNAVVGGGR
jgi:hypothetical protein